MDSVDFKFVEQMLYDYPNTYRYIRIREAEMAYVTHGQSDVLKGLIPEGEPLLRCTMKEDRELQQLKLNHKCVSYCLAHTDKDTQRIIEELYFKDGPEITLAELGNTVLNMTKGNVSKKRKQFFEFILEEIGLRFPVKNWKQIGNLPQP